MPDERYFSMPSAESGSIRDALDQAGEYFLG
jgi:hypothetical protein